jgi:hypothetical protein
MTVRFFQEETYSHRGLKGFPLSEQVLYTHVSNEYISTKMTLDNYDELTDP